MKFINNTKLGIIQLVWKQKHLGEPNVKDIGGLKPETVSHGVQKKLQYLVA